MTSLTEKELDDYVRKEYPDLTPAERFGLFMNLAVAEWKKATGVEVMPVVFMLAVNWAMKELAKAKHKKAKRLGDGT